METDISTLYKSGTVGVETKKGKIYFVLAESRAFMEPTKLLLGRRILTFESADGRLGAFSESIN